MAWNQPGGQPPGGKDPWGRGSGGQNRGSSGANEWLEKLQGMFGGGNPQGEKQITKFVIIGAVVLWSLFGFYRVEQAEQAVTFRFGQFTGIKTAGLHWHPPLIDSYRKVNVERTQQMPLDSTMITKDENLVDVSLQVQYRIADPKLYTLAVVNPESTLAHAAESALRHVVGSSRMTMILNEGRAAIAQDIQPRLQSYLDTYKAGISIRNVNILEALPPKDVKAAFDDVIRAKEDMERLKNQAETYANGIVPEARGMAARLTADANAFKQEVVDRALGDASRFDAIISEYRANPRIVRTRMYLETMESVLGKANKILVEPTGAAPLLYLPMDKLGQGQAGAAAPSVIDPLAALNKVPAASTGSTRDSSRPARNMQEAR